MDIVPQSDPLAKAGTEFVKDIVGGKEVDTSILKLWVLLNSTKKMQSEWINTKIMCNNEKPIIDF